MEHPSALDDKVCCEASPILGGDGVLLGRVVPDARVHLRPELNPRKDVEVLGQVHKVSMDLFLLGVHSTPPK